jgi:hypothetical protein
MENLIDHGDDRCAIHRENFHLENMITERSGRLSSLDINGPWLSLSLSSVSVGSHLSTSKVNLGDNF